MKSGSLKRIAQALSTKLGYKVFRTTAIRQDRKQFRYSDAVDKLQQYKWFQQQGLSALEFTTQQSVAKEWSNNGVVVIGRKLLNASCGAGIEVFDNQTPSGCPVYTKYKPKKREFRVHIFKDKVVAIVEKKLRSGHAASKIRNLANGYVFCQDISLDGSLRSRIEVLGLAASKVCNSDFKGVDVAYNEKNDDLFVIEVNSAPGIEGSNVDKYVKVIGQYV